MTAMGRMPCARAALPGLLNLCVELQGCEARTRVGPIP